MDLVRVKRLEDPERMSLFVALSLVNLDAQQGRSLVKGLVDPVVGIALASNHGFARPPQSLGPPSLAPAQSKTPSPLLPPNTSHCSSRDPPPSYHPHPSL